METWKHKDEALKVQIELKKPQEANAVKLNTKHLEQKFLDEEPIEMQSKDFEEIKQKPVKFEDKESKFEESPLQILNISNRTISEIKKLGFKNKEEFVKFSEKNLISFHIHFGDVG